jgi:hypothetical protein
LGHQHYEFVRLEKISGLCEEKANAFNDAVSSRKALSDELKELKEEARKGAGKRVAGHSKTDRGLADEQNSSG